MPDAASSIYKLVRGLLSATGKGTLDWKPTDEEDDSFRLYRSSGAVNIRSQDADGSAPWVLEIFAADGGLADTVRSPEFDEELLRDLYLAARRRALKIDQLALSLLDEIEAEGKEPF